MGTAARAPRGTRPRPWRSRAPAGEDIDGAARRTRRYGCMCRIQQATRSASLSTGSNGAAQRAHGYANDGFTSKHTPITGRDGSVVRARTYRCAPCASRHANARASLRKNGIAGAVAAARTPTAPRRFSRRRECASPTDGRGWRDAAFRHAARRWHNLTPDTPNVTHMPLWPHLRHRREPPEIVVRARVVRAERRRDLDAAAERLDLSWRDGVIYVQAINKTAH